MVIEKEIEAVLRENKEKELRKAVEKTRMLMYQYFSLSLLGMIFCLFIPIIIERVIGLEVIENVLYYLGAIGFVICYLIIGVYALNLFLNKGSSSSKIKLVKKLAKIKIEKDDEQFIIDEFFIQAKFMQGMGNGGNEK